MWYQDTGTGTKWVMNENSDHPEFRLWENGTHLVSILNWQGPC